MINGKKIRQIFISEHIFMILSSRAGGIRIVLRQIRFTTSLDNLDCHFDCHMENFIIR